MRSGLKGTFLTELGNSAQKDKSTRVGKYVRRIIPYEGTPGFRAQAEGH